MATQPTQSVVDTSALGARRKARTHPKGRPVDPRAADEIRALLGDGPIWSDMIL
jgi:hypothetical protein